MSQIKQLPATIAATLAEQPSVLAAHWRGRRTLRLKGSAVGAELAGRLLADEEVQTVVVSPTGDEATVHLAHRPSKQDSAESMLRELADLAGQQNAALAATTRKVQAAPEIVCWLDRQQGTDSYYRLPAVAEGRKRMAFKAAGVLLENAARASELLPVVPATPLSLLAAECWLRSDRERHQRLLKSAGLGGRLSGWYSHRQLKLAASDWVRTCSAMLLIIATGGHAAAVGCLAGNVTWLGWLKFWADTAE